MNNQHTLEALLRGETITVKPHGNSMTPLLKSGDPVTLKPITLSEVKKDDIVFCKVNGHFYIHLVTAVKEGQVQISNNHGHVNGWTTKVYGKAER